MNCANSKKTRRVSGENLLVQIAKMCHSKLQMCCNFENSELRGLSWCHGRPSILRLLLYFLYPTTPPTSAPHPISFSASTSAFYFLLQQY